MSDEAAKDLALEARNFSSSLSNVFHIQKRDQQTRYLLEKAQFLIDGLLDVNQRLSPNTGTPRQSRENRTGQMWVKLQEMTRENGDLRRQLGRHDDKPTSMKIIAHRYGYTLNADLKMTKNENEALKAEIDELQKSMQELQSFNNTLQDEYKRVKADLESAYKSLEEARQDCRNLEASISTTKTEIDSLKRNLTTSVKPVRTDSRMTEDINERCRPSLIAMRYDTLESQEWMDAKESLEDSTGMDEEEITRFLCSAIMKTYGASCYMCQCIEVAISELIRRPALAVSIAQSRVNSELKPLPEDMLDAIRSQLRQTCDLIESAELIKLAQNYLQQEFSEIDINSPVSNKDVMRYLHESARLTWQMAIQQPPMKMSVSDERYNEERHKLWWSCDQARASNISHFIWPALFDSEDGNLVVKGCVYAS